MALLAVARSGPRPYEYLIHSSPSAFLLTESDLPAQGAYRVPDHERYPISNDLIVYLLGDDAGNTRIGDTHRILGWRVHFARAQAGEAGPDHIIETVTQYASAKGARANLKRYRISTLFPETGWRPQDGSFELGDQALIETRSRTLADGTRQVGYAISFIYRNMGVRIEVTGRAEQVTLEDAIAPARLVLDMLHAAPPCSGQVPTPTPGFEAPEENRLIYR